MQFDYITLEEKFKKLPEEVQYALTSPKVSQSIQNISQKNGLMLDQMEILFDITTYVMLGLLPSSKFTLTLAQELNISEKQARIITSQISDEVFVGIKESMREYEEKLESTYHTSLGNTQMNANTYPQSFKPINDNPVVQKPVEPKVEPVTVSPHADLEKAGGFTIEAIGNPLPDIQKPKPKPVELPKIQENQPEKITTEVKTEPVANTFRPHEYYNFKNNSKEDVYSSNENVEDDKKEAKTKETENIDISTEKESAVSEKEEVSSATDDSSTQNIIPDRIVFKHSPEIETKPIEPEPVPVVENPVTETVDSEAVPEEVNKTEVVKETGVVKGTEILPEIIEQPEIKETVNNNKSTVPDNLPTEETDISNEVVKEEPPIIINTEIVKPEEKVTPPVQTIQTPAKPVTENKPRAFDPYREIPQ